MESKASSEHHLKPRLRTISLILLPVSGAIVGVVGFVTALWMAMAGKLRWEGVMFICGLGLLVAFGFGWIVLRFVRRVLTVKTIQVLPGQQLQITTRTNQTFTAKLPDNIRYTLSDHGLLTIAIGIGSHVFVIDSAEYSDSEQLNQLFSQYTNRPK